MTGAVTRLLETAAELVGAPWEAQCAAGVLATVVADGVEVRCQPMTIGSVRAVRDFRYTVRPGEALPLLLTALGGCVAATAASSLALRGIVPAALTVQARSGPAGLAVRLVVPDCAAEQLAAALVHVRRYSPMYRLLAGPGELRFAGSAETAGPTAIPAAAVSLTWTEGLHAHGDRDVDEPRQLAGADRAPSPLEYLLGAVAAESLSGLGSPGAEVHVSGRRDLRGWFGFPDLPPEPRALLVQRVTPGVNPTSQPTAGVVAHLVSAPQWIESDWTP